jgi:hypothetical protein
MYFLFFFYLASGNDLLCFYLCYITLNLYFLSPKHFYYSYYPVIVTNLTYLILILLNVASSIMFLILNFPVPLFYLVYTSLYL